MVLAFFLFWKLGLVEFWLFGMEIALGLLGLFFFWFRALSFERVVLACLLSLHWNSKMLQNWVFGVCFAFLVFSPHFGVAGPDCNEPSVAVSAEDSSEIAYFQRISELGDRASLQDYLHLWYPHRKSFSGEPYFLKCQASAWGVITSENIVKSECQPDTFYSYGPAEKVETLQRNMRDGEDWDGKMPNEPRDLFSTLSPASTFYYGPIPVRLKVKVGTRFEVIRYGGAVGSVTYRNSDLYQDFTFRDAAVIDSWSFGTPEHYDEIVRDILKLTSGERAIRYISNSPFSIGISRMFENATNSYVSPTENGLRSNLVRMVKMILSKSGRIYYNRGSCRNRALHFQSKKPSYIHAQVEINEEVVP